MRPLALVCDPEHDYSRRFYETLDQAGVDVRHVRSADECLAEVHVYLPRSVLISSVLRSSEMAFLLNALGESAAAIPDIVVTGPASP